MKTELDLIRSVFDNLENEARQTALVLPSEVHDKGLATLCHALDWAYRVLAQTVAEEEAATSDLFFRDFVGSMIARDDGHLH